MNEQGIRDIIRGLLHELPLSEVVMAKPYIDEKWDAILQDTLEDLFHDVGVDSINAERNKEGSQIELDLSNGDRVLGMTTMNPLSGFILINGSAKKELNGPQALRLVVNMREFWEEYSQGPSRP